MTEYNFPPSPPPKNTKYYNAYIIKLAVDDGPRVIHECLREPGDTKEWMLTEKTDAVVDCCQYENRKTIDREVLEWLRDTGAKYTAYGFSFEQHIRSEWDLTSILIRFEDFRDAIQFKLTFSGSTVENSWIEYEEWPIRYRGAASNITYNNRVFTETITGVRRLYIESTRDVILSREHLIEISDWLEFHQPVLSIFGLNTSEMYDVHQGKLVTNRAVVFRFQEPSDAVLFKLTFGEYDVTSEWVQS